jgi:hypothetical protein
MPPTFALIITHSFIHTTMTHFITCPSCSHDIHLEDALAQRIETSLQAELATRAQALEQRERSLEQAQARQEQQLTEQLRTREAELRTTLRRQLETEQRQLEQEREQELTAKTERINELLRNEADLRRQKRELETSRAALALDVENRVAEQLSVLERNAREKARAEAEMTIQEKQLLIDQLRGQVTDMNRKMEQGSMQVQGEAQEIALEQLLRQTHPHDQFEEVRKGELGADLMQRVRNEFGKDCGLILYESKRTKAFSEDWIAKLKGDIQQRRADMGVIVTQTLPRGVTQFELRENNIYICTFGEVRALSYCLRAALMKVDEVRVVQANQGDKSRMLYDYLMGQEFKNQLQLIHATFQRMHGTLAKEKQSALRRFKQREKELETVLDTFAEVVGSLNGIAGHTLTEFADFELLDSDPALLE